MPLANADANVVPRECARPRDAAWVPKRKYTIVKPVVSNTPSAMQSPRRGPAPNSADVVFRRGPAATNVATEHGSDTP